MEGAEHRSSRRAAGLSRRHAFVAWFAQKHTSLVPSTSTPAYYFRQRSFPLSSPKQCPSLVRITTFLIRGNCFSVALTSAVTRASAPIPGEVRLRQNLTVAVPVSVTVPFLSSVSLKSGPPTGRGAEQFDGPLSMVLSSVK